MNQLSMLDLLNSESNSESNDTQLSTTSADDFGCCSRYRQCSAEMRCLIADRPYSERCAYRKHLESGVSYYGKNATDFDADKYERYKSSIASLSDGASAYYRSLLTYFFHTKRGLRLELVYKNSQVRELEKAGVISTSKSHNYVLSHYKNKAILQLFEHDPSLVTQWNAVSKRARSEARKKEETYVIKDVLIPWLKESAPEVLVILDEKYCFASFAPEIRKYAEEYWVEISSLAVDNVCEFDLPLQSDLSFLGVKATKS